MNRRRLAFSGTLAALLATLLVQACTSREVVGVVIDEVDVLPPTTNLIEGETFPFTATVRDDRGNVLEAAEVEWTSDDPGRLVISSDGMAEALDAGTATVRASFRGVSGTAQVTVIAAPAILVDSTAYTFFGGAGEAAPPQRGVTVTNGGGGVLDELSAAVDFAQGEPAGWLSAALASSTAPTTLTLALQTTGLAPGTYTASVLITSPDDRNGAFVLTITLTLTGIAIVESGGTTVVDEAGNTTDDFSVALAVQPTSDVVLTVVSADPTESVAVPATLTFTPGNWNVPQTVTVSGVDDENADGNVTSEVVVAVDDNASDPAFAPLTNRLVSVTTIDDDQAGVTVGPTSGLTTSEDGDQATFNVVLQTQPSSTVVIGLSSSDETEGRPTPTSLTFTPANWATPQAVTVLGIDDDIDDGDVAYTIVTAQAVSTDPAYLGVDPANVSVTNADDGDAAGITVSPTGELITTETGGTPPEFTVVLDTQPTANVSIAISSDDETEGTVTPTSVTFTPATWNIAQRVAVTSVDDDIADGDVVYTIVTAPATSADPNYDGLNPPNVSIRNIDDESPGITVTPAAGPITEAGGQTTFTVVLNNAPSSSVTIGLSSTDTSEGTLSAASVSFTTANWSTPQAVTVTGVDDFVDDGDVTFTVLTAGAVSADPSYSGYDAADVSVTNVDDDAAGFTVSAASGPTTEGGGQATFGVRLTSQPTADVTVALSSSDPGEGSVGPSSLTFTGANWSLPQTVTVTGQDDQLADGNATYEIVLAPATSADASYQGLDPADVTLTNVDDETAGITVSAATGPTTEAGGVAGFTVVLNTLPSAGVTIALSSTDTSEGMLSVTSLAFTPANWSTPQTVVVTGVDDALDDGDIPYVVVTAAAASGDPDYAGIDPDDVSITNVDDDVAGFAVSPPSGPTTEAGGSATFTVSLTSEPTADVTINLTSTDTSEGTVSPGSLTFTTTTWSVPQTVTVSGRDDQLPDGNVVYAIVTGAAVSTDPGYSGRNPADVTLTNVDDETAGITVSPISGPTTEAGGQATLTVVLNAEPTADVTIGISSSDPTEGVVSTSSLTFTSANWDVEQTVTVTGQDDDVDDDNVVYTIVTAAATSSDASYSALDAPNVSVTNVDDDDAGFVVSVIDGPTTEAGGIATFTVALTSEPTADVTVGLSSSDLTEGTVAPPSLTFTSANWDVAQTVTVTGADDAVADGNVVYSIVTAAATSSDTRYGGLDPVDVSVTNVDDESVGITVSGVSGPTTEAGGSATFTVVLNTQPSADVTIALSSSDLTEGTVSPASLTFTSGNWNVQQTVIVTGVNDDVDDGNIVYTVVTGAASSADGDYNGLNAADVVVTNNDDDAAGFTVSAASAATTEAGGQATFTVVLTSQPLADVTIALSSSDPTEGLVSTGSLTFTSGNWNVVQTVTVTGVNDDVADGNVVYAIVTGAAASTDPGYSGRNPADVTLTNVDDETAGISVSAPSGPTTEAGGQATFTVRLNTQPTADVTIGISSSDLTEGVVSTSSLTFTSANWNVLQTVTVTGQNDDVDDENIVYTIVTAPATSTDPGYNGLDASDVLLTNIDDDAAGFTVSAASGPTTEAGGIATFTVALTSEPTADVTVGLSSSDLTEGTVAPLSLTFTSANWDVAQTVTVTGIDDLTDDGNVAYSIITAPATSGDPRYNGLNPSNVSVTNNDDDQASITVSAPSGPTTEDGGQATFTVVLSTQPSADVTIALSSSDLTEGTVSPASLTFTSGNWNVQQTVTVTGVDDLIDDGNVVYSIVTAAATSSDASYNGVNAADVSLTNVDDEEPGIAVSAVTGPTTEAGGQATFTVVLTSQPSADVAIALTSTDTGEGTVSPASLTFTSANWNVAQTVTVTGVDDLVDDGNIVYVILTAPASSADPIYDGLNASDVQVTNIDDETAGISVSAPSGPTTEAGGQATFTVVLNSQPTADVSIGLSSTDPSEGTVAPSSLTFTSGNWSTPQVVTVTGVDDLVDDGNVTYSIVTAAASSGDVGYNGVNASDVLMTNVDDETAGFVVSPASGPTTETGGTAAFSMVLASEPTADVTVGLSSSDLTEGTVAPPSLTFTSANWSTPQFVTITGQNDAIDDDNVAYAIVTAPATSADGLYSNRNPSDVSLLNLDDGDTAGVDVTPLAGLVTSEAAGTAQFSVVLTSEPVSNVTITVASTDTGEGTVGAAPVFTAANWNTPQLVTVTGVNDFIDDDDQPYAIVTGVSSADPKYTLLDPDDVDVTNADDGDTAGFDVTPLAGLVTSEAAGTAQFSVVLTSEPVSNVTITVASTDTGEGTVGAAPVFTAANWNTPQLVTVTGVNDFVDDDDQPYTIVTGATSLDAKYDVLDPDDVAVTNSDDDTAGITVNPTSGLVTNESGAADSFTIVLDSEPLASVAISVSSNDPGEGTVSPSSVTFTTANWNTPQTVTVTGADDGVDDGDIGYTIVTAAATSGDPLYNGLDPANVTATNLDNEVPQLSIDSPTLTEGNSGTSNMTFTVTMSVASTQTVTVQYVTNDGTATAPADYTSQSGTLTFIPGDTTEEILVPIVGDALDEVNETVIVNLSNPTNATITVGAGTGTISDDDPTPSLAIGSPSLAEGNSGTTNMTYTVTLSAASGQTVTVQYVTNDGTATAPADYTSQSGTLTFVPGDTSEQITVPIVGDVLDEANETVIVNLSNPTNATVAVGAGVGTITDDDPTPTLSINNVSGQEGDTGTSTLTFTVTLSAASGRQATVNWGTANDTATGGAVCQTPGNGSVDYVSASGTLTFNPGTTTQPIQITVCGDNTPEGAGEAFFVNLSAPVNATIADGQGDGAIIED